MTPRQAYSRAFIFSSSHTPRTRSRHAFRAASRGTANVTSSRRPGGAPRSRVGECDGLGKFAREQRGAFRDGFELVGYAAQVLRREIGHRYVQGVVHADAVPRRTRLESNWLFCGVSGARPIERSGTVNRDNRSCLSPFMPFDGVLRRDRAASLPPPPGTLQPRDVALLDFELHPDLPTPAGHRHDPVEP